MSKSKHFVSFSVAIVVLLAISSRGSAQNNLTAKGNSVQPVSAVVESDRLRDGLAGPVRRVRSEVAKLSNATGRLVEDKRIVLEVAAYDNKGSKIENQYFPVAGSTLTGKEVYQYDEKGNISEMTLLNVDGSLLSREVYKYDYDSVGNWTKMTSSVAVVEAGKVTFEPTEVTYRSIMYYLDENMLKMAQPTAQPADAVASSSTTPVKIAGGEAKPQPIAPAESKPQAVGGGEANHKSAAALPPPLPGSSRSNAAKSPAVKSANVGPSKGPIVVLDAEPPPPAPKPLLKQISGGVLNGNAISLPAPAYPDNARLLRIGGVVSVMVVLDETGKVISARVADGPQQLREASVRAALKARFSPTKLSGQPVKVSGVINYKFVLP
jgi:TonB family protein